jgi:hypothetical protein
MGKRSKTPFPINDDVDRALLQVHRAVCKMVLIAAVDRDTELAVKAATALGDLGAMSAGPVAAVIEQIPWAPRRLLMVHQLREIPPTLDIQVTLILMRLLTSDPSEQVRAAADEALGILRERSHEKFKQFGIPELGQYRIADAESGTAASQ